MRSLQVFKTLNNDLDRVQNNIKTWTLQVIRKQILDGILIEGVDLSTSETLVNHGLGRPPQGWTVVDLNSNETIYRSSLSTEQHLKLTASGTVTVSLWVF